jgi:alanyl-tRNA synthetase
VKDLVQLMGAAYPNLAAQEARITEVLKVEEERFFETLATGMEILDERAGRWHQGLARRRGLQAARHLRLPARSVGRRVPRTVSRWTVPASAAMEQQKAKGRAAGKFKMDKALEYTGAATPSPATSTCRTGRQDRASCM